MYNTFRLVEGRLVWSTFVTYERPVARVIWPPISLLHRLLVRFALRRAALSTRSSTAARLTPVGCSAKDLPALIWPYKLSERRCGSAKPSSRRRGGCCSKNTQVRFDEALHEFDTVPGVKEDVTDLILNIKDLVLRCAWPA